MVIRGAPAIGQAAAYGVALTAARAIDLKPAIRRATIRATATSLRNARPTAANLGWAVDRMLTAMDAVGLRDEDEDGVAIADALRAEAERSAPRRPATTPSWPTTACPSCRHRSTGRSTF